MPGKKAPSSSPYADLGTRDRILLATADLLRNSCLHSISIRDIAQASDANSALISYHFGSKDKLYEAVIQQQFEAYQEQVVSTFRTDGDIQQNLRDSCQAIANFHKCYPNFLVFYFRELTNPSPCYTEIVLPLIAESSSKATAMIQAGIDQGIFKPDLNPRYAVQSMIGMINYCFMTCSIRKDLNITPASDITDYLQFALQMLLNQIKKN